MNEKPIKMNMGDESVRVTPDGKIFVKDAINLVSPWDESQAVWEKIKEDHPEILDHCEHYRTREEENIPVVDSEGWDKIISLLPGYLFSD